MIRNPIEAKINLLKNQRVKKIDGQTRNLLFRLRDRGFKSLPLRQKEQSSFSFGLSGAKEL